ncbi:ribonuclease III [Collinsella sp. zg1085]|uniref:ribonuclease III n=1 Tax=Collinsella sp. zg1085 TaxID=2844380 RepID=UPI001C0D7366|nr:ribonuclease III [Collinsella sp. zg1085]QWT17120.1 ribonuclease III [Collinsella sp. zg1085]
MSPAEKLARAETICAYSFKQKSLLRQALTHPSAVGDQATGQSYERLEFLGDSILGSVVAAALYEAYPSFDEGKLTRLKVSLVSGMTLSEVGEEQGITECIFLGASELGTGSRGMHSALENVYEALVGALYLDGGIEAAESFIMRTLRPHLAADRAERPENPKSYLLERVQADRLGLLTYKMVDVSGPPHQPRFTAVALLDGARQGKGTGSSKKEAEAAAALDALERLGYTTQGVILKRKLG